MGWKIWFNLVEWGFWSDLRRYLMLSFCLRDCMLRAVMTASTLTGDTVYDLLMFCSQNFLTFLVFSFYYLKYTLRHVYDLSRPIFSLLSQYVLLLRMITTNVTSLI